MYSQDQEQEHNPRNLRPANGVEHWEARPRKLVVEIAVDGSVCIVLSGFPGPEQASSHGEYDGRNAKTPDNQIGSDVPARVYGAATADEEEDANDDRVVEEGKHDLWVKLVLATEDRGDGGRMIPDIIVR